MEEKKDLMPPFVMKIVSSRKLFNIAIWTIALLVICLIAKSLYLFLDTTHYYVDHATDPSPWITRGIDKYIRELDIAGLLGGIIGILISLYITAVIENSNKKKEEENNEAIKQITDGVKNIWEKEKNFRPIDDVRGVMESIAKIFDNSSKGKPLYIMNHSASFGYLLGFKLHTVLDYNEYSLENLKSWSYNEYHSKWKDYETYRDITIKSKQSNAGKEAFKALKKKSVYVTLSPEINNNTNSYVDNYLNEVIESDSTEFIFYDRHSQDCIKELESKTELKQLDNIYLVHLDIFEEDKLKNAKNDEGIYETAKLKKLLLDKLVEIQKTDIKELKASNFEVKEVNNIYYQVYLNEIEHGDDGACLFMFVNHQTISDSGRKLLAFESRKEKYVMDSFINIINSTK